MVNINPVEQVVVYWEGDAMAVSFRRKNGKLNVFSLVKKAGKKNFARVQRALKGKVSWIGAAVITNVEHGKIKKGGTS